MRSSSRVLLLLLVALTGAMVPTPARATRVNSFVDDDNSRFEPFIETASEQGIIRGCNPPANDRVCPSQPMTRGDMAIMLARSLGLGESDKDHFIDDEDHASEGSIDALIDAGVPMRCGKSQVCPDRLITRGEMSSLLRRAFEVGRAGNPSQYDDLAGSQFRDDMARLAADGGLLACDPPANRRLCPDGLVRRDEAVFALVSVMRLHPAAISPTNSAEPEIGFGDSFNELDLWDGNEPSARNRVRLTGDGFVDKALRVEIPKGSHFGADFKLHLDDIEGQSPQSLYFRYYLKLDRDWLATSHGKLPGFSGVYGATGKGGYRSSPSDPGWSARLMFSPNHGSDRRVDLGYYVYHLGQETRYGDGLYWNEAGKLVPGQWYCLEGEVRMNKPGIRDGALRAWVDGTSAFDLSGLEFRRPSEPEITIESFWFDVYYGGKSVAPQDLGMAIDEVMVDTRRIGCGGDRKEILSATGDIDGNGFPDDVSFGECPGTACFTLRTSTWNGPRVWRINGESAWFAMDTYRLGLAAGDVDGDGRDEVLYRGRCDLSMPCWRVHDLIGVSVPKNWGDGARLSDATETLVLGDWNGDGLDDLAYRGLCDRARGCWWVQLSTGERFREAADWGVPPEETMSMSAADVNGDGRDDLVYTAPCDESRCWFALQSTGDRFGPPRAIGRAMEGMGSALEWIDFNGDGTEDMVSWVVSEGSSWIEVRRASDWSLSDPVTVRSFRRQIEDVALRRLETAATIQAVVQTSCDEGTRCVGRLMALGGLNLVDAARFRDLRWNKPGGPRID